MRKFLFTLTAGLLITTTIAPIVACSNPFNDSNVLRVTLVTDGHTVDDNSFNQSTYQGALDFQKEYNQWIKSQEDLKINHVIVNDIQPPDTTLSSLIQSYTASSAICSKVTLATGFIQRSALIAAQNNYLKNSGMRYVLVDSDTETSVVPNKNLAGLLYKAEQSGFLAGIAAICWLIANADQYGGIADNNLKLSAYGGIDNIPGVVNYMYGFYWAIGYFNQIIVPASKNDNAKQQFIKWISNICEKSHKNNPISGKNLPKVQFVTVNNQFSGDFTQASNGSKAVNEAILNKGADVIFAVSGPQTEDTIGAIRSRNSNAKIIGVDTDQAKVYPASASMFITSALKNITNSVTGKLWNAIGRQSSGNHEGLSQKDEDEIFKHDAVPQGGKNYIGIANNLAINSICTELENYFIKQKTVLDQITNGWNKVQQSVTPNKTMWDLRDINPFQDS